VYHSLPIHSLSHSLRLIVACTPSFPIRPLSPMLRL
jgi:hypothetical protein